MSQEGTKNLNRLGITSAGCRAIFFGSTDVSESCKDEIQGASDWNLVREGGHPYPSLHTAPNYATVERGPDGI